MNAPLSSHTLTHARPAVQAGTGSGLFRLLGNVRRRVSDWTRRQATIDELSRLSDRELADIGLSRSEVRGIFTRAA